MDAYTSEWLNLIARWVHIFVGILWIGQTWLFTWLDGELSKQEAAAKDGAAGQVWMVHSGGFYVVNKEKTPGTHRLHWFRWEAALTWLSGMVLLVVVYYLGGALIDPYNARISPNVAIALSLAVLAGAWLIYDLLALSPLGKNIIVFAVVSFALIVGIAYGLLQVFSERAAFIHVGAIFGTIMAANVWMRILPGQKRMIAAAREGRAPDAALAARAKLRSKHNTYLVVPLIFTMISNHFPTATYGSNHNLIILACLILVGWVAAHFIRKA